MTVKSYLKKISLSMLKEIMVPGEKIINLPTLPECLCLCITIALQNY